MSREIRERESDLCEPVDTPIWIDELQDSLGQKNKPDGETDEDGAARCASNTFSTDRKCIAGIMQNGRGTASTIRRSLGYGIGYLEQLTFPPKKNRLHLDSPLYIFPRNISRNNGLRSVLFGNRATDNAAFLRKKIIQGRHSNRTAAFTVSYNSRNCELAIR
jgi:hypothetical protein